MSLCLSNGSIYKGTAFGSWPESNQMLGEVVFQTGMVGYIEAITDPSYAGQILVFTQPMIGNYKITHEMMESVRVQVSGIIIRDLDQHNGLDEFLHKYGVPGIYGIDTRALTLELRTQGTMIGGISSDLSEVSVEDLSAFKPIENVNRLVYSGWPEGYGNVNVPDVNERILVIDCGLKKNQLDYLNKFGYNIMIVPCDADLMQILFFSNTVGIFISNGPGDPADLTVLIENLKDVLDAFSVGKMKTIPIFGICLGHQILALAAGGQTEKMKYGNRGQNIPVRLMDSERGYITSQNHGYQVNMNTLNQNNWSPLFTNLNDHSNEGIYHKSLPIFSVQFHPEARAGPWDTEFLFEIFHQLIQEPERAVASCFRPYMAQKRELKQRRRVLLLGSGGLTIGQAGEFDYSGSQALKAYKEMGLYTILINPNIATVQTTTGIDLADKIYSLPVTPEYVEQVIEQEYPDCIAVSFGGQTALNCAIELYNRGVFDKYQIEILGTEIEMVIKSEDRAQFKEKISHIDGARTAASICTADHNTAIQFSEKIGYPVLVRSGFALGGLGSGFAHNREELQTYLDNNNSEVIIDKSIKGWREVEYEIVRDSYGNTITVCNMENLDPVGVHTGESIVIAPSQTLNDREYFLLREMAIKVANDFNIVGECNIQYAMHPETDEFYIIEINARLSRSSALASKATGYPLAYIAAKLSLGFSLLELKNAITRDTTALFEPSLDYCALKIPRWDLDKFSDNIESDIGSAMKSVGEVLVICATFQEALLKGLRMTGQNNNLYKLLNSGINSDGEIDFYKPSIDRILNIIVAYYKGIEFETDISPWFLQRIQSVANAMKNLLDSEDLSVSVLNAKRHGLSDREIAMFINSTETEVRNIRKIHKIHPVIKRIDTVAGEFPCDTNYLYLTYNGSQSDQIETRQNPDAETILVIGSGVYRIGSSVEFDWCSVNCVKTCKKLGYNTMMLNYNPETVSTDYDMVDTLFFEEISAETVLELSNLYDKVIVSVGGQESNNIVVDLDSNGVDILGTSAKMIDNAENRYKFSRTLSDIGVDQPIWARITDVDSALKFCQEVSYPCLIRPSYVLSGAAMNVAFNDEELTKYLAQATEVSGDYPVVITKFIIDAKEIEVDAVAMNGEPVILAISEHIENAGVHSGDATLVCPPQDLTAKTTNQIKDSVYRIAKALQINGPFNIQFIAKDDQIKVIECNVRSSRSYPFVSKVYNVNLIEIATKVMLNQWSEGQIDTDISSCIGVKAPQFSFKRLPGADCVLGVEMMSTGEVACFDRDYSIAYLKSLVSTGIRLPKRNEKILISIGSYRYKMEIMESIRELAKHYNLYATTGTADFYKEHGIKLIPIAWTRIHRFISDKTVQFVINVSMLDRLKLPGDENSPGYLLRMAAIKANVPLLTDVKNSRLLIQGLSKVNHNSGLLTVNPEIDARADNNIVKLEGLIQVGTSLPDATAISNGFTQILIDPNTTPALTNVENLNLIRQRAVESNCDYGFILGANSHNHSEIAKIMDDPEQSRDIVALKIYLNGSHSEKDLGFESWHQVEKHYQQWRWQHPIIVQADYDGILKVLGLVSIYKKRTHITNISSDMLDTIISAKKAGLPITCGARSLSDQRFLKWVDCIDSNSGVSDLEIAREKMYTNVRKIFNLAEQPDTYIEMTDSVPVRRAVIRNKLSYVDGRSISKHGQPVRLEYTDSSESHVPAVEAKKDDSRTVSLFQKNDNQKWTHRNILAAGQFTRDDLRQLFKTANSMMNRESYQGLLNGKTIGLLFYEPSTRTECSFVTAIQKMGGNAVQVNVSNSSITKGETLEDTIHCLEQYVDAIIVRGKDDYAVRASQVTNLPVINAGDGVKEHPTQALLDLFTIREEHGTVTGLTITLIGDLKNSRTVHSLVKLLCLYNITRINYVSIDELKIPDEIKNYVRRFNIEQHETGLLESVIEKTDVLYVTRLQAERIDSNSARITRGYRDSCQITPSKLSKAKQDMIIMHPLPRKGEISEAVDTDPRAVYFKQMKYGLYTRMALLNKIFT